jgi:hypothetical protein
VTWYVFGFRCFHFVSCIVAQLLATVRTIRVLRLPHFVRGAARRLVKTSAAMVRRFASSETVKQIPSRVALYGSRVRGRSSAEVIERLLEFWLRV